MVGHLLSESKSILAIKFSDRILLRKVNSKVSESSILLLTLDRIQVLTVDDQHSFLNWVGGFYMSFFHWIILSNEVWLFVVLHYQGHWLPSPCKNTYFYVFSLLKMAQFWKNHCKILFKTMLSISVQSISFFFISADTDNGSVALRCKKFLHFEV